MQNWIFSEAERRLTSGDDIVQQTPKAAAVRSAHAHAVAMRQVRAEEILPRQFEPHLRTQIGGCSKEVPLWQIVFIVPITPLSQPDTG